MNFLSPEQLGGIKHFVPEATQALEHHGYLIFTLTGQSIKSLRKRGLLFSSTWHESYPDFENLTSRLSQVAIHPDPEKFFLLGSNNRTLLEHEEMARVSSNILYRTFTPTRRVLGQTPDFAELALVHASDIWKDLFRAGYEENRVRTQTEVIDKSYAYVGSYDPERGLYIGSLKGISHPKTFAALLIVPE